MGKLFIPTSLTQINWNSLKVPDYFQYPLDGYKYLRKAFVLPTLNLWIFDIRIDWPGFFGLVLISAISGYEILKLGIENKDTI